MFCSKCGKTLDAAAQRCSCGQEVGESRFAGVPYTSAQVRIAPGDLSQAEGALPYTRTTYTGMDDQLQAGADADARTTYRPVYEGSSVPEDIRRDVRAAVGSDGGDGAERSDEVDPLVREMFRDGEDAGIDDFDLSQLRPRPIVSEGRAGISRDVTEYVERLAVSDKGPRRSRRRKIYGEGEHDDNARYEEVGEEVFQDVEEDDGPVYDAGGTMRLVAKIAGALALIAVVVVGGKMIYDKVAEIRTGGAPIAGVTLALYDEGIKRISEHADPAYVETILISAQDGYNAALGALGADAEAITALLPEEPGVNDPLFVEALSAIQTNIGNAVTMDVLDMSAGAVDAAAVAKSEERWTIVQNAIAQLTSAKTAEELTAIIGGKAVEVVTPTEPAATATPVAYKTLSKDDRGEDVRRMQQRLYELGYLLEGIDGQFGTKTQTAVKKFQQDEGLEVSGIADQATLTRIYADDAPRTEFAQPTPAPATAAPTPTPVPTPEIAEEPALLTANSRSAA